MRSIVENFFLRNYSEPSAAILNGYKQSAAELCYDYRRCVNMKKSIILLFLAWLVLSASGCSEEASVAETVNGNLKTYYEMSDGTWMCDELSYKYRMEINGRMPNAAADSTFIYLSNLEEISFDQAWKATGLSSFSGDYFSPEDAVLVDWGLGDS